MSGLFVFVLLASAVSWIVGIVNPKVFSRFMKNANRKNVSWLFGLLALAAFIGVGLTAPATPEKDPVEVAIKQEESAHQQENRDEKETVSQSTDATTSVPAPIKPTNLTQVTIARVVDGDTVVTSTGERIRYIGIDTPETVHPFKQVEFYGKEASDKNKELVEGKTVEIEKDVTGKDKYGRTLAYIWLGNEMVNGKLVGGGYAYSYTYPPNVKYTDYFVSLQAQARTKKAGLWANYEELKPVETKTGGGSTIVPVPIPVGGSTKPSTITPAPKPPVQETPKQSCSIKGNISSSGEKIYHLPSGRDYGKTQIDTSKGERWFCSEAEAVAAGWRASKV